MMALESPSLAAPEQPHGCEASGAAADGVGGHAAGTALNLRDVCRACAAQRVTLGFISSGRVIVV